VPGATHFAIKLGRLLSRLNRAFGSIGGRAFGAPLALLEWRALWLGMSRVATRITRIPGVVVAVVVAAVAVAIRKFHRIWMRLSVSCRTAAMACSAAKDVVAARRRAVEAVAAVLR